MNNDEYIVFLKSVLVKIENALNLLSQTPPKHIPSYNKMLGVQQKFAGLNQKYKDMLFPQMVVARSVISYFTNGRYNEAISQILKLKNSLVKICLDIKEKSEKNTNEKI